MDKCCYCGSMYDISRDHVIPQSYLRFGYKKFERDWLVPACKECNSILCDQLIFNVPARAAYLLGRYEKKYRKLLELPSWDEEELEELSNHMKASILSSLSLKKEMTDRVIHLRIVASMDSDYLFP